MSDVMQILSAIEQGDPKAAEALLPLVYDELRQARRPEAGAREAGANPSGHGARPRGVCPAGASRGGRRLE